MTIDPKTIKKMREMKAEGFLNPQIAQELEVAVNSVIKYTKDNSYEEQRTGSMTSQNQQLATEKNNGDLEEQLQILEIKPKVEDQLNQMILTIDEFRDEDTRVLSQQLWYLWDQLEDATDLKKIKKIEELIAEGSELSKKFYDAIDRFLKNVEREANIAREEDERKKKLVEEKYNHQYNFLKHKLNEVIEDVNGILSCPITAEEIDDINKEMLPYGQNILDLAEPSRFTCILKRFGIPEDKAKIISNWWRKRIYGYA